MRKVKGHHHLPNEMPAHRIICFTQSNLHKTTGGAMLSSIMLNEILTKQDVMHNFSTCRKSSLSLINQKNQHKLKLRTNELRYIFINHMAARDYRKSPGCNGWGTLRIRVMVVLFQLLSILRFLKNWATALMISSPKTS